jgi:hypothetical protein
MPRDPNHYTCPTKGIYYLEVCVGVILSLGAQGMGLDMV